MCQVEGRDSENTVQEIWVRECEGRVKMMPRRGEYWARDGDEVMPQSHIYGVKLAEISYCFVLLYLCRVLSVT